MSKTIKKYANLHRALHYVGDSRRLFGIGLVSILVVTIGQLSGPLILRSIIDESIPRGDLTGLMIRAGAYLAILLVMGLLSYMGIITISRLGLEVVTRIKYDVFSHLLTLPVSYFDAHPVGELISRTESDSERVRELFSQIAVTIIVNTLFFLGMLGVCFYLEPRITLYLALATPTVLILVIFVFDKLRHLYDLHRQYYAQILARITEFIQGWDVLRVFNREAWAIAQVDESSRKRRDVDVKSSMLQYGIMGALNFSLGPLFMVLIILFFVPQVVQGALTVGTLLVFFEYSRRIFEPLMAIAENIRGIQQARVSLDRIFTILDLEPETASRLEESDGVIHFEHEIEFRHVWFAYKGEDWVLKDVSFTIKRGETIAVVGASGSGKSTTIGLLCGFYRPQRGEILIDGQNLAAIDLSRWRRSIGLVLQDVYLFPGSILENIRLYDDSVGEEHIWQALEAVHGADFVRDLPMGLASELRERGGNISAGEKQLLSFARALAFNPQLIILDEATASVDVRTERKIHESMQALFSGRTALVVAHRLSSIQSADCILFFKDGQIVQRGRHEELLAGFPPYAELVRLQFPNLDEGGER
ncbi:ABC transporter ATP-binding protein [Gracilinema caldarium]|uniref:ABC transporter ATP-binding protein n=1 Tax=Gracilinema caldarium TaxID=215591 RepID=UPI0026ED94FD|nr:ABC transporter ATP-binding protein [Gracilinema caldarium]